jgi:hypothetical protein
MKRSWMRTGAGMGLVVAIAGCGGSATPGGGGGAGAGDPAASVVKTVTVTSDDERTAHTLQAGRYRASWKATGCTPHIVITSAADESVIYDNPAPKLALFVSDIPDTPIYIEQTEDSCSDWQIKLDKV